MEKWTIAQDNFTFYAIVTEHGKRIATGVPDKATAILLSQVPQMVDLRWRWSGIINRLAHCVLDGADSNDRDWAEEMIAMVRPYLENWEDEDGI